MKKWLLSIAGVLLAVTLAGCSDKTVATTNGGKITQDEFYESLKKTDTGKQTLQQMILDKVLEKEYGKDVTKSDVSKKYKTYEDQYGDTLESTLKSSGYTVSSFKKSLRSNLLLEEAVRANTKITDAKLKAAWKNWQPKVTVSHILFSAASTATDKEKKAAEDKAKDVIKQLEAGKDFATLAKKLSEDTGTKADGGKLPAFDSTDTSLDADFKTAAFKLKQGDYTKTPVKTQFGYHVIKMDKNPGKGKMADHTKELKEIIIQNTLSDQTQLTKIIGKVLKKGNVKIKDTDLKDILADYLNTSSASSTATSTSK